MNAKEIGMYPPERTWMWGANSCLIAMCPPAPVWWFPPDTYCQPHKARSISWLLIFDICQQNHVFKGVDYEAHHHQTFWGPFKTLIPSVNNIILRKAAMHNGPTTVDRNTLLIRKCCENLDTCNQGIDFSGRIDSWVGVKVFSLRAELRVVDCWSLKFNTTHICAAVFNRENIRTKKNFKFGHCPNYLDPTFYLTSTWFKKKVYKKSGQG